MPSKAKEIIKDIYGAFMAVIGFFMVIIGTIFALIFPQLEGKQSPIANIVVWIIPITGLYLLLRRPKK